MTSISRHQSPAPPELVFVYGTLKRAYHNNYLLDGAQFLGTGMTVCRFPLVIRGLPYLLPYPMYGHHVSGEVYRVSRKRLHLLDHLEGHPEWYRREKISVVIEGIAMEAWTYFLSKRWVTSDHLNSVFLSQF